MNETQSPKACLGISIVVFYFRGERIITFFVRYISGENWTNYSISMGICQGWIKELN